MRTKLTALGACLWIIVVPALGQESPPRPTVSIGSPFRAGHSARFAVDGQQAHSGDKVFTAPREKAWRMVDDPANRVQGPSPTVVAPFGAAQGLSLSNGCEP
jgi:hypothetical protein